MEKQRTNEVEPFYKTTRHNRLIEVSFAIRFSEELWGCDWHTGIWRLAGTEVRPGTGVSELPRPDRPGGLRDSEVDYALQFQE